MVVVVVLLLLLLLLLEAEETAAAVANGKARGWERARHTEEDVKRAEKGAKGEVIKAL